ncbi:putative Deoxynucleoside triphosphate triphosphohydrolase SAMHD1 [Blattamonas nauphoetae]|uniref:Deoxynucleoside triphosphate triphosphohydrolase SAMHD1 n=1 Tax=Blattamonas nauphoetae TaxID=2049346 RepID=A0ABQ9YEJ8_9EUKA|nr:putative Deoxynucleoside triphosphate triphosphohydrolase SAMHD1 [Blattamonas nauphoetae]
MLPLSSTQSRPLSYRTIFDPIHGYIDFNPLCFSVIDTPEYQRLRELHQLGLSYYVFPGATHKRFEHSLGVGHLANRLARALQSKQPELEITDKHVDLVTLAGLCHDLGHGPFSHCFENFMHRARPELNFDHEKMSCQILDHLVSVNNINLTQEDLEQIKMYIVGDRKPDDPFGFLSDIVANKRNSVDVDKFDYLARDSYNIGIKNSFDFDRLMLMAAVIDNEICFPAKEAFQLYELFQTRYSLHKQVYSHKTTTAIDLMVIDMLLLADPILHISDIPRTVEGFVKMNDSILLQIEHSRIPELAPAQAIITRLRKRHLYKLAVECLVHPSTSIRMPTAPEVIEEANGVLQDSDFVLQQQFLNFSLKDKNPVDSIHFFSRREPPHPGGKFKLHARHVSLLLPAVFQETYMRIYLRHDTNRKHIAAEQAFVTLLRSAHIKSPPLSQRTPHVTPRVSPQIPQEPGQLFRNSSIPGLPELSAAQSDDYAGKSAPDMVLKGRRIELKEDCDEEDDFGGKTTKDVEGNEHHTNQHTKKSRYQLPAVSLLNAPHRSRSPSESETEDDGIAKPALFPPKAQARHVPLPIMLQKPPLPVLVKPKSEKHVKERVTKHSSELLQTGNNKGSDQTHFFFIEPLTRCLGILCLLIPSVPTLLLMCFLSLKSSLSFFVIFESHQTTFTQLPLPISFRMIRRAIPSYFTF